MEEFLNPDDISQVLSPTSDLIRVAGYHVTVKMTSSTLSTPERGAMLLNAESALRSTIDHRIEVFLEPRGDMNKLRLKLRGVKV